MSTSDRLRMSQRLAEYLSMLDPAHTDGFAALLVSLPDFDVDTALTHLRVLWWGDNPVECRRAWEALERARKL